MLVMRPEAAQRVTVFINPEQSRDLSRREQSLVVAVHVQSPPTVSLVPQVSDPSSLALNEYFRPRFLEIRSLIHSGRSPGQ